jgi:glutathione S-transferase
MSRIAKLHVVTGSIPCGYVEAAMAFKGFEYRRVELPFGFHRLPQKLRYGRPTVPGLTLDGGEKVLGSIAIVHRLDAIAPDPPLYPADAESRAAVEAAETWGDDVLTAAVRRVHTALIRIRPSALLSYAEDSTLPAPRVVIRAQAGFVARRYSRVIAADDDAVRADFAALPEHLDRVDDLIASSTIGGDPPNGADLQIGASIRSLATLGDLAPLLAGRPAADLIRRLAPMAGHVPAGTAPAEWLAAAGRR